VGIIRKTTITILVTFLLICVLSAPGLAGKPKDGEFTVNFKGVSYNTDGTSTWTYTLRWNGKPYALSYFLIELGQCTQGKLVGSSPQHSEFGRDGVTRIYGIKWEYNDNFPANQDVNFSFTLNGHYEKGSIRYVTKAGPNPRIADCTGPSITCQIIGQGDVVDPGGGSGGGDGSGGGGDGGTGDGGQDTPGGGDGGSDTPGSGDGGDDSGGGGDTAPPVNEPPAQPGNGVKPDEVTKALDNTTTTVSVTQKALKEKRLPDTGMNGWSQVLALFALLAGGFILFNSRYLSRL